MNRISDKVVIREVGLRDGLQSIHTVVSTQHKCEWIRDAVAAGQTEIEVGSFVPPSRLPQLADTADVLAYAKTLPGLFASVLVPNLKGAERALEGDADLMLLPLSASHAHSPCPIRHAISMLRLVDNPHSTEKMPKPIIPTVNTRTAPNRPESQPVSGTHTASATA